MLGDGPPRFTSEDLGRLTKAILAVNRRADSALFPSRVVAIVADLLESDICAYNEIDHAAGEFRPVHDYHGDEPARYYPMFVEHERDFPIGQHVARTGKVGVVKNTDLLSQSDFEGTGLYNEFFRKFQMRRLMVGYLRPEWGCQVCVSVHRRRRDFSERERALLTWLLPHIRQASEDFGSWSGNATTEDVASLSEFRSPSIRSIRRILLASDLSILESSDGLGRVFKSWFPGWDSRGRRLPEPVIRCLCEVATASKESLIGVPRRAWALRRAGGTLTFRLRPREDGRWELMVVQELRSEPEDSTEPPEARPAPSLAIPTRQVRSSATGTSEPLTPREREVLHWLCEGKRNAEIGVILRASPNTIRKHVQRILAKTRAETRGAAIRMAFERGFLTSDRRDAD